MPTFTGKTFSSFYKNILGINQSSNTGVDSTVRGVQDGDGNNTAIALSDDNLLVKPQNDDTTEALWVQNAAGSSIFKVDTTNSKILVDTLEGINPDSSSGPVTVSMGASVTGGTLTINGNANFSSVGIVTAGQHSGTSINVSGIVTATSFSGDGSGLSNLPVISEGKAIALTLISV